MLPMQGMLKRIVGFVCTKLKTHQIHYNLIILIILVSMTSFNMSQHHGSFPT